MQVEEHCIVSWLEAGGSSGGGRAACSGRGAARASRVVRATSKTRRSLARNMPLLFDLSTTTRGPHHTTPHHITSKISLRTYKYLYPNFFLSSLGKLFTCTNTQMRKAKMYVISFHIVV